MASGDHVGPFEILDTLGAGGMGEVYRARDPKLLRDVAIKVLPQAVPRDAVRLARFEREARALAALSHPNIAAIYGVEQHHGIDAPVLELVDGETLASRIAHEPITVSEALAIAGQVAAALDAAHEKGIVHRDLKPANIVITPTGLIKVLDFGLATIGAAQERDGSEATLTVGRTHDGMVVGTPAYMSPEQARGLVVDKRTDIWAFGCVLYEMLTGRRLFGGDSAAETLAFVLTKDLDWSALPSQTPPAVRALLRRCLERERAKRLGDVAAIRFALEDVSASNDQPDGRSGGGRVHHVMPRRAVAGAAAVGALLIIALALGLAGGKLRSAPAESPRHLQIALPPQQRLAGLGTGKPMLAMSRTDRYIAYVATTQEEDARQIYVYSIEHGTFEPVPGSVGAHSPFFSPDEEWLGFFIHNRLMKIPVTGGVAPESVAEIVNPYGASWTDDRRIIAASFGSVLQIFREEGGVPEALSRLTPGDTMHRSPYSLPGGKAVLYNVDSDTPGIFVQQIGGADRRRLISGSGQVMPQYSPSGHLVYGQTGSVVAVPFDPATLQARDGIPTKVVSGVRLTKGVAHFTVSSRGSLAYVPGEFQPTRLSLVRISRNGTLERTFGAPGLYNQPRVAPDARRFVVDALDGDPPLWQLWLYDLRANELSQFTYRTAGDNRHGTWVESNQIIVQSNRTGTRQLFLQPTDGGTVKQLTEFPAREDRDVYVYPVSTCSDVVTFVRLVPNAEGWVMHLDDSSGRRRTQRLDFPMSADGAPSLSPDCRWLAYVSDESGRREVWVRAVSNLGKAQQISKGGGNEPVWNPDRGKRELFFRDGEMMIAARISDQGSAEGKPERLFLDSYATTPTAFSRPNYDVFPDGSFLMLTTAEQEQAVTQINVVLNWREELTRRAPGH